MMPWFRRAAAPGPVAPGPAASGTAQLPAPLALGTLLVELVHVPARRAKRPPKAVVQLSVGHICTLMHPQELRALLAGGVGIIDSHPGRDSAFFCDATGVAAMATAGTPAEAGKWMAAFPPDALALVTGPATDDPAAVVGGADKALLGQWLKMLPFS